MQQCSNFSNGLRLETISSSTPPKTTKMTTEAAAARKREKKITLDQTWNCYTREMRTWIGGWDPFIDIKCIITWRLRVSARHGGMSIYRARTHSHPADMWLTPSRVRVYVCVPVCVEHIRHKHKQTNSAEHTEWKDIIYNVGQLARLVYYFSICVLLRW